MTLITVNGSPIIEGTISAPNSGAWWAEVQTPDPLVTGTSVVITDETTQLVGTVQTGGSAVSRGVARIIGGKGKLQTQMAAKHWRNASAGKILGDICSDLGESRSNALALSISGRVFPFWSQPAESGGSALHNLANQGGWVWRVLPSGEVWLGDASATTNEQTYSVIEPHPEDNSFDVAPEGLSLWVGKAQAGAVVKRVEYSLGERLRCTYWV